MLQGTSETEDHICPEVQDEESRAHLRHRHTIRALKTLLTQCLQAAVPTTLYNLLQGLVRCAQLHSHVIMYLVLFDHCGSAALETG